MSETYYSNGKLLLTGEYAVLDGALSLAVPTKYGQSLEVRELGAPQLRWTSLDENKETWFQQFFQLPGLKPLKDSPNFNPELTKRLRSVLVAARELQPEFLSSGQGAEVTTRLDFDRNWGLGTSSTLLNNIAQWARIDPYELLRLTFGGSGYDIACAIHNRPLLYRIKDRDITVREVEFDPDFKKHLCFVHLNKKQDSRSGIAHYKKIARDPTDLVKQVSQLTEAFVECRELDQFLVLIEEHEKLMEGVLQISSVQKSLFPDYRGAIKSLGAWGGDFILAASNAETPEYFYSRGFPTVIPYTEMVLAGPEINKR